MGCGVNEDNMAKRPRQRAELTAAQRAAAHFREYAAQIRILAEREPDPTLRDRLRAIVEEYEARANELAPNP